MESEFRTVGGSLVRCGQINRRLIDPIWKAKKLPQPPMVTVEVWGGSEEIPDYSDEIYQLNIAIFRLNIEADIFRLFSSVTEFEVSESDQAEYEDLKVLQQVDLFSDVILSELSDRNYYIDACLYFSTVTELAISEAMESFDVRYMGTPVQKLSLPGSYAERMQLFEDRQAAKYGKISWQRFCELSGPEQSEYIAFMRLDKAVKMRIEMERKSYVTK